MYHKNVFNCFITRAEILNHQKKNYNKLKMTLKYALKIKVKFLYHNITKLMFEV